MTTRIITTCDEWEAEFEPTTESMIDIGGVPLDTDLSFVWTEVEGEGDYICIAPGYRMVNRLGYWITKRPHDFDVYVEEAIERDEEE